MVAQRDPDRLRADRTAAERDHARPCAIAQQLEHHALLQRAEGLLALAREDLGDRGSRAPLKLLV
jgi:hypothetical protein